MNEAGGQCPACAQSSFDHRTAIPNVLDTDRCQTCGLIVAHHLQRAEAGYELVNEEAYAGSVARMRSEHAEVVVAATAELAPPTQGTWVDVGCGPGVLLARVREAGYTAVGLEPDPIVAEQALAAVEGLELHRATLTAGLLPDGSASVVSTMDVLEHIPPHELHAFAGLVRRALAAGGIWVIKLPTSEGLFFRVSNAGRRLSVRLVDRYLRRLWQTDYTYPHTVYFDRRSLGIFLGATGFDVEESTYLQEVTLSTAYRRLRIDPTIPTWQALVTLPAVAGIVLAERLYGKTDALLVIARRR